MIQHSMQDITSCLKCISVKEFGDTKKWYRKFNSMSMHIRHNNKLTQIV